MKTDDFEQQLRRQPLRLVPSSWREEILEAARPTAPEALAPKRRTLSPGATDRRRWLDWFWPSPAAWAGLAALWLVIWGLDWLAARPSASGRPSASTFAGVSWVAWAKQRRLLAELIEPEFEPRVVAEPPKPFVPRPRSERITDCFQPC